MVEKVQIAAAALHLSLQFVLGAFLSSSRESQTKTSTSTESFDEKYLSVDKSIDVNFVKRETYDKTFQLSVILAMLLSF